MSDMPKIENETYLADGLYAGYDGYQIWLWADRENGRHYVALDDTTVEAFEGYLKRLRGEGKPI